MNKFIELYRQQNNQVVVALVGDRYHKNQPIVGGKIIGQVAILIRTDDWSKGTKVMADAVRVDADTYNVLCSKYGTPAAPWFPGLRKESVKKSDTDKKTFALRKALELSQYKEDPTEICTFEGYTWRAGDAVKLLKAMDSEFNKPNKKQLAMFAAADSEQPAAPVVDTPEPEPETTTAADIVRAGIETGKVIICSVPKAEPAPQLPKPPAVVYIDTPTNQKTDNPPAKKTAADEFIESGAYPIWYNSELVCSFHTGVEFKVVSWGRKQVKVEYDNGQRRIFPVRVFIDSVERGDIIVAAPYDAEYMAKLNQPTSDNQKPAATDAEVMEQAERIRASYEALKAEAEREQAAAAFAEAITVYCEELEQPAPLAWEPETIIVPFMPRPAAEVEQQPRRRHRLNLRPRLSRWLNPVRRVAVVLVCCVAAGLLIGASGSHAAADDAAAEVVAQVVELEAVTVTAEAPQALIEDEPSAPSPVKKLAAPSPVKNVAEAAECSSQKTDAADCPAGEKTASPMNTASDPHGLTICEGTPWAYTMMNWA